SRGGRAPLPAHVARKLDEGVDRAHTGRGGHRGIGLRVAGTGARAAAGHPAQRNAGSRLRPADPLRHHRGRRHPLRHEQLLRFRRQQRLAGVRPRMSTNTLAARIEGIGFWADGLPSWSHAVAHVRDRTPPGGPGKPAPRLLAPNERRRAPPSVAVALEVALAACEDAGREPSALPSVFASTHGDLGITDYMCETLASEPGAISPTKFHNSVHNA